MGEGGVILTNNGKIADFCRSSASQGRKIKNGQWLEHVRLGYNFRINELSCAVGLVQVKRAKEIIEKRKKAAALYNKKLQLLKDISIPYIVGQVKVNWWIYVIKKVTFLFPRI